MFAARGFLILVASLAPVMAAHAETAAVSTADCRQLADHVPRPDVEYKPGVDVHGNAVAPADLGGGYQLKLPESVNIQIGIDLADRLGLQQAQASSSTAPATRKVMPYAGYAPLGTLTIKGNEAFWNGAPLTPQDQATLTEACRQGLTAAGATLPTEKPAPPK